MRVRRSLGLGLAVAAVAGVGAGALVANAAQTQNVKAADSNRFEPATITVAVGDTVHWTGSSAHTATSDPNQGESWDSGSLTSNGFDHTFKAPGTYSYHCTNHQALGMVGKVVVQEGGTVSQPTQTGPEILPQIAFKARSLRSSRRGVVGLRTRNPNSFPISGTVRIDTVRAVTPAARKRRLKLGSVRFSLNVGQTKTLKVKLSRRARRTLKRYRKLKVNLTFRAGTSGQRPTTIKKRNLTLRAPRRS